MDCAEPAAGEEKRRGRGKESTGEEAKTLAESWILQSNPHPHQKEDAFWAGIEKSCRERGMRRSENALKTQWCYLNRNVQKYIHTRNRVLVMKISGISRKIKTSM